MNMAIGESKGMMDKAAKAYMNTADAGIRRLNEAWDQMKVAIGEEILPHLGRIAKALADVLLVIRDAVKHIPGVSHLFSALIKIGTVVLAVKAAKLAFAGYIQILRSARGFYQAFTESQAEMGKSILETAKKTKAANKIYQATTAVPFTPGAPGKAGPRGPVIEAEWSRADQARAPISKQLTAGSQAMVVYRGKTQELAKTTKDLNRAASNTPKLLTGNVRRLGAFSKAANMARVATGGLRSALAAVGPILSGFLVSGGLLAAVELISRRKEIADYAASKEFMQTLKQWKDQESTWNYLIPALGMIRKGLPALSEAVTGISVEQQLKNMKILEIQERFKDLAAKRRQLRDKLNFQEGQAKLEMGTRPFVQAVNKLEKQLAWKPQLVKKEDIQLLRGELERVIRTGAGGVFAARGGKRMQLTSRDIDYAQAGLTRIDKSLGLIKKVQLEGGELTGKEAIKIGDAFTVGYSALRDLSLGAPEDYLKSLAAPAKAMLHSVKKPAMEAERLAQMTAGARNVATGSLFGIRPGLPVDKEREAFEKGGMETIPASVGGTMGLRSIVGRALGFVKEAGATIPMEKPMVGSTGVEAEMAQAQHDTVRHLATVEKEIATIAKSIELVRKHGINVNLPQSGADPAWDTREHFPIEKPGG
jgi:hypothetical protein